MQHCAIRIKYECIFYIFSNKMSKLVEREVIFNSIIGNNFEKQVNFVFDP